jgi:hypothetical protein
MGSKLRKLRVQAAAAGERYQAELRAHARKVERARRLAEEQGSKVAVSSKRPGVVMTQEEAALRLGVALTVAEGVRVPNEEAYSFHADGMKVTITPPPAAHPHVETKPDGTMVVRLDDSGGPLRPQEPRPPAAGMRLARRMPLLAQVALLSMMLSGEPPKGYR